MSNTLAALVVETGWLRRLARSLVEEAAAEDLIQDTHVAAADAPDDGRPIGPWLVRVMRNLSRMSHRTARRRRAREQAVAGLAQPPATPAELVERVELHRLLASLVLSLDPPARDVVLLVYGEGLSSQEAGTRLGIAAGTVRWRLKLALEELRAKLDDHQPKRVWTAALAGFAGLPRRALPVAAKLLAAAAIALLLLAGWLALQVRGFAPAAQASGPDPLSSRVTQPRQAAAAVTSRFDAAPSPDGPISPGRRRLVGRVIDVRSHPVADADVLVTCGDYPFEEVSEERIATRTTPSGAFSAVVDSTCQVAVAARHAGQSATTWMHDFDKPISLTLRADVIATIHVIDAVTDSPVEGARVVQDDLFAPNPTGPGISDASGVATLGLYAPPGSEFDGIPSEIVFVIRARGYVPTTITAGATVGDRRMGPIDRTVRLERGLTISGQVLGPDGRPVPSAALFVTGPRGKEALPREHSQQPEPADASGSFETHVPGAGIYTLYAYTPALQPADARQGVVEIGDRGGAGVVIQLVARPASGVEGLVVDRHGHPVAGARLTSPSPFITPVMTNEKGAFRIPGARRPFDLVARSGDLASEVVRIDPALGKITGLTLTLATAGVTGIVVDADGQPVANAQLWVNHQSPTSDGREPSHRYFTDARGGFAIDVPRGAFVISVRRSFDDDFLDQDNVVLVGGTRGARVVLP